MASDWIALPLNKPLFANLHQDAVGGGFLTAVENGFVNEQGGHTRFPGLREFVDLGGNARVYLHDFDGDLVAATSHGQVYRVDRGANVRNVTDVPVSGGRRTVFAKSDRDLLLAAGGPIVRLRADKTELLSKEAPEAALIGWIDGFTIAVEINSQRFYHSKPGTPDQWDPLDTFAADGQPDNINALLITPFRELMLGGEKSIEQFERSAGGDLPFFRRWSIGDGVKAPYATVFADNAMWTINGLTEFVRVSGQTPASASNNVGMLLESVDDWSDAWIGGYPDRPLNLLGQKFILLQAPNATNVYGTKGVTLVYDHRLKRFFSLFGWHQADGVPDRWPGWSHWKLWERTFVGGEGKIYELTADAYRNGSVPQRWLVRTSHMAAGSMLQVNNLRLRVRRGFSAATGEAKISVRCSRDAKAFGPWITRGLGAPGDHIQFKEFGNFGTATSFMFEISCEDNCPIDLIKAEVKTEPVER